MYGMARVTYYESIVLLINELLWSRPQKPVMMMFCIFNYVYKNKLNGKPCEWQTGD